jgi:adenosylhomocysteine nucleosidase
MGERPSAREPAASGGAVRGPGGLLVVVALREESRAVERALRGHGATVLRTGIGQKLAQEKAARAIEANPPRRVIVAGFGGGLRPGIVAGDVVAASTVCEPSGQEWSAPADLVELAASVRVPECRVVVGRLVTVEKVIATVAAKQALRAATGADAVDMESSGVLRAAAARGIPVLCLRAILDEAEFELPFDFGKILTPEGRPRILKALGAVTANPGNLARILPLRRRALLAAERLEQVMAALATRLP